MSTTTETAPWCRAISQHGQRMTVFVLGRVVTAKATPRRNFVCTQDQDHQGEHAACDGNGHILARWPRRDDERYWQSTDCRGHAHGGAA